MSLLLCVCRVGGHKGFSSVADFPCSLRQWGRLPPKTQRDRPDLPRAVGGGRFSSSGHLFREQSVRSPEERGLWPPAWRQGPRPLPRALCRSFPSPLATASQRANHIRRQLVSPSPKDMKGCGRPPDRPGPDRYRLVQCLWRTKARQIKGCGLPLRVKGAWVTAMLGPESPPCHAKSSVWRSSNLPWPPCGPVRGCVGGDGDTPG